MPIDLPVWVKAGVGWAWPKVKQWGVDWFTRAGVSRKSMDGGDLAGEGSLPYLVKMELERLASDPLALPQIRSEAFRSWITSLANLDLFVSVLVAKAGGRDDVAANAYASLADKFQEAVGETSKLATGWINVTISYIHGQLNATDAGRSALQIALGYRNTAQLDRIESLVMPPSAEDVIAKARKVATGLLVAGRRSWKMPRSVAPLTLEEHKSNAGGESQRITIAELASAIDDGRNLILFGSGGIGKTTYLLELCGLCLTAGGRIPLFIDAAVWARSNASVLDYIVGSPAAQVNQATAAELADRRIEHGDLECVTTATTRHMFGRRASVFAARTLAR
ncbi:hypothetical protein [Paraburkholderia phytofirmans]|nr:hypothetical protein [Paraburkholderia phytofirmans]